MTNFEESPIRVSFLTATSSVKPQKYMLNGSSQGLQRKSTATGAVSWSCDLPIYFVMLKHNAVVSSNRKAWLPVVTFGAATPMHMSS